MVPYLMKIASLPRFMTHVGLKSSFSSIMCKINIPKEILTFYDIFAETA
jgi:hypothetical protein